VNHSNKEYVRGNVTTNTVEDYFGLLKRGLTGTYHHVSARHLHRYWMNSISATMHGR
jgi:hypothetical protein